MNAPHAPPKSGRSRHRFWSVDSAPHRLSTTVPRFYGIGVLLAFLFLTLFEIYIINSFPLFKSIFPQGDILFIPYDGGHSIPFRLFILTFYASFCLYCAGNFLTRLLFFLTAASSFILFCGLFDLVNLAVFDLFGITQSLHLVEIISGIVGFAIYSFTILDRGEMPTPLKAKISPIDIRYYTFKLVLLLIIAMFLAYYVDQLDLGIVRYMREIALLGGIGPGVFLFLPLTFGMLYLVRQLGLYLRKRKKFAPPISIIVPAHNEAHCIAGTLRAIDAAALAYSGAVDVVVANNNSTDKTVEIVERTLSICTGFAGRLINVPRPGKAFALNAALDAVDTEFVIRIDADTQIRPNALIRGMTHFSDPDMGVLGGLPRVSGDGPFDHARQIEVLVNHGFYQVAMSTIGCIMSVPGMFAAYRTELLHKLGGFVSGMNGEDTDISVRIGELGYYVYTDPKVRYLSEVPNTYMHMREQRMRWFRSVYHVTSRNRRMLFGPDWTLRGKLIMPFMLVNSARRAMMIPLLIFGTIHWMAGLNAGSTLEWPFLLAVLIGSPALMTVLAAIVNGMPGTLLGLPGYLLFRAMRSYFTLESMLSIVMKPAPVLVAPRLAWSVRAASVGVLVFGALLGVAAVSIPQIVDTDLLVGILNPRH